MKKITLLLAVLFCVNSFAQVVDMGKPQSWKQLNDSDTFQPHTLPTFDQKAIEAEDKINDTRFDRPWRFGFMHSVDYGFDQGQWVTLDNGDRIWRILIESPGALSLNFIFDDFFMPQGGYIHLYNNDRTDVLGAYTAVQNQESGILGTWLVEGDAVWIEYYEPAAVAGQGRLHIAKATHGYRNAATYNAQKGLNDSGDCNLDVDCPIGADWELLKEHNKKSVGILLSGGSGFCTGALINNTNNDGTPYFLTANHCFSDPSGWAFRFGWISPDPVCADTADSTPGPTDMTISGGTLRARNAGSDFCLVEINSAIPVEWNRVWAGWDKTDNFPTFQVGIHHPAGDIMKVCRDDTPATKEVNAGADTWEIVGGGTAGGWELGVTEPGSSGSPLFDQNGSVIGQLFGGGAACSGTDDNDQFDYYGRFAVSWDGASSATRLHDWLDPSGLDPDIQGSFPPLESFALDGAVGISIPELNCGNTVVEPTISLSNFGTSDITTATIEWSVDGGASTAIDYSGTLGQFESESFDLGPIDLSVGSHTFDVVLVNVNGGSDENDGNDTSARDVDIEELTAYETTQVHMSLLTDDYAEETSWEFTDSAGNVLYSDGPYQQTVDDNTLFEESFDVVEGECYFFTIFDAYGDGICCGFGQGEYSLTTDDGTIIFEGGEFGSSETTEIGIDGELGIVENILSNVAIYPNPANEFVTIRVSDTSRSYEYSISNILGQVIGQGTLREAESRINTGNFNTGLYFVTITDTETNSVANYKVIKQ
ncbi:MAG: T9SS type A sorting domain-containing protein [Flavobacteriaceae bacterium]|nr:T9SS type A sorting domain-containing protein [Flavobacteriaceae bacterium]